MKMLKICAQNIKKIFKETYCNKLPLKITFRTQKLSRDGYGGYGGYRKCYGNKCYEMMWWYMVKMTWLGFCFLFSECIT